MATDQKLTDILKGRRISGTQNRGDTLTISFTDGSQMTVTTAGSSNSASTGGTIAAVRQAAATLYLDMDGGATLAVPTVETADGISVQDKNGTPVYPD